MTLETFWKIRKINDDQTLSDEARGHMTIAAIHGLHVKDIPDLPLREFERLSKEAAEQINGLADLPAVKPAYMVGDTECELIANPARMNMLQFSSLVDTLKFPDIDFHLATILSFILVPKGFTYPDNYDRLAAEEKIAKNFDVRDALAIVGELQGLFTISQVDTLVSSALTQVMAWTDVPRWRRALARMILIILIRPKKVLGVNGRGWTDIVAQKSCGGVWTVAERLKIIRFLNIVSYCHDEENEKKRQMDEWQKKHKK